MKFALPFYDDSTLIFAATTQRLLRYRGHEAFTILERGQVEMLSDRQISGQLPGGPDIVMVGNVPDCNLSDFDAVIVCKSTSALRKKLSSASFRGTKNRPAYVAFQPGLEFTPEKGMKNRQGFDVIFFNSPEHKTLYDRTLRRFGQTIAIGHPYFLSDSKGKSDGSDVVFFAQAISPRTYESRRFILDVLLTIAEAYPDRNVILKLRHLRTENLAHAHRELFDYQTIFEDHFPMPPKNFKLSADPLPTVMATAGICITCTSTAAMDAIARNIPTLVYLDYPEHYKDDLAPKMRTEFAESGLIATLPQVLHLAHRPPRKEWFASRFRTQQEFIDDLVGSVNQFKAA